MRCFPFLVLYFFLASCVTSGPVCHWDSETEVRSEEIESSLLNSYRSFLYYTESKAKEERPLLIFFHGYFDATPEKYEALLRQLAGQGYVVVYPGYGNMLNPRSWSSNAREAIQRAFQHLEAKQIRLDRKRVAFVGHSIGGLLAFHLAARWKESWQPRLLLGIDTAGISTLAYEDVNVDTLGQIPRETHLALLMAEDSYRARLAEADSCADDNKHEFPSNCNVFAANQRIFQRTRHIPEARKDAILIPGGHNAVQSRCEPPSPAAPAAAYQNAISAILRKSLFPAEKRAENALTERSLKACLIQGNCP